MLKSHFLPLLSLLALAGFLYTVGSPSTGFQGTDELRYGKIAKELEPGRDMFLLHFNGRRYSDKPPAYFWLVAASYRVFGFSPFALRIPGLLSGMLSVLLTYGIALTLTRRTALAFLAAAVVMVMPRFLWISRWGRLDIPMCLFVYVSMLSFVRAYFVTGARLGGWVYWIALGCSFAIKGPAGAVVILGSSLTFLIWQGERGRWKELFHPGGVLAAVAINLAWVGPILLLGDAESSSDLVVRQDLGRVFNPWRHVQPPWYYLGNIWYDAAPAALFACSGGIFLWRRRKADPPPTGGATPSNAASEMSWRDPVFRFAVSWIAFTMIFFSIYLPKRGQYLLPMYPAMAILAVLAIERLSAAFSTDSAQERTPRAYFFFPSLLLLIPLLLLGSLLLLREPAAAFLVTMLESANPEASLRLAEANAEFEYGGYSFSPIQIVLGLGFMASAGFTFARFAKQERLHHCFAVLVGLVYILMAAFFGFVIPPSLQDEELHRLGQELRAQVAARPDLAITVYGDDKPFYNIYEDFHVAYFDKEERDEFRVYIGEVTEKDLPRIVIMETKRLKKFKDEAWLGGLSIRTDFVRGDEITIFESFAD